MTRLAVDSSALLGEPEAEQFDQVLFACKADAAIAAANLLEVMMVIEARNPDSGVPDLRTLMDAFQIAVEPVTSDLTEVAFRAWKRFGTGRHPASLNFGDCFAYALSKHLDAPLLYKGNDFTQTDVRSAPD